MKVKDLIPNTTVPEITVQVLLLKPVINGTTKDGRDYRMRDATVEDDTGTVTLTLWNEQVNALKEGDVLKITNGWAKLYQPKDGSPAFLQVSSGSKGKVEVIE